MPSGDNPASIAALKPYQFKPGVPDPRQSAGGRVKAADRVMYWVDLFGDENDDGTPKITAAEIEEILDAPAGDTEHSLPKRAAAKLWIDCTTRGANPKDAIRALALILDRQLGTARQSVTVDGSTVHIKRIILDTERHDLPEERPPELVDLLTNAEVVPARTTAPEQHSSDNDQE